MQSEKFPPLRPTALYSLHEFKSSWAYWAPTTSTRDELLQHSRYIRDYLTPLLATQSVLPAGEMALMSSIMARIGAVPMTIELLRYSRIEKALMVMAYEAQECWPADIVSKPFAALREGFCHVLMACCSVGVCLHLI